MRLLRGGLTINNDDAAPTVDGGRDNCLLGSQEKTSPIIESLRAAAISSFGPVEAGQLPLRLTMISDMVQNTSLSNQFQIEPNFQQLTRSPTWPTLQPQLKGADVDILYLLRLSALRKGVRIQNRGHEVFWEQLVTGAGGHLLTIDPYIDHCRTGCHFQH
jgi:hypothetical protein